MFKLFKFVILDGIRIIAPRLWFGFGSRPGLVLGLGGNQIIALKKSCPSFRVRVWLRVSFGVGEQFSLRAVVLEPTRHPEELSKRC